MIFSVVVPVYNRPQELHELLESLVNQDYKAFEVLIVEDGSVYTSEEVVKKYQERLRMRYFFQENSGQGFARNFGMEQADGDYYVLFDSDCIIPPGYLSTLYSAIRERMLDAHGGPDAAAKDFSIFQKAINFSMTSFWTTGGIRGKLKDTTKYQARGFNLEMSKEVFAATGGFVDPYRGEDIELSIRITQMGYRLELVEEAYVFHKRKNTLLSFFAQAFSFGRNRINVSRYHPDAVKLVHLLPLFFLVGFIGWLVGGLFIPYLKLLGAVVFGLWTFGLLVTATWQNKSISVGVLAIITSYGQLLSYGMGILWEALKKARSG